MSAVMGMIATIISQQNAERNRRNSQQQLAHYEPVTHILPEVSEQEEMAAQAVSAMPRPQGRLYSIRRKNSKKKF